jgi:predicted Zn finger-like uncharacterized protein
MDVTCDKCRTEYEFDESLISESGTTVKCTNCGHLFRIYRPGTPDAKRRGAWMLRQPDGSVYTFERMTTLQRWIAEGKVSKDDMVSRTGEGWQALGSMQELVPFFRTAQAVLSAKGLAESWTDEEEGPTIRIPPPHRGPEPGRPDALAARPDSTREPPRAPPPRPGTPSMGSARVEPAAPRSKGGTEPPIIRRPGDATAPKRPIIPKAPKAPEPLGAPPTAPTPPTPKAFEPSSVAQAAPQAAPATVEPPSPPAPGAAAAVTLAGHSLKDPTAAEAGPPRPKEDWSEGALLDDQAPAWTTAEKEKEPLLSSAQEPAWTSNRISQISQQLEPDDALPPRSRLFKIGIPVLAVVLVVGVGAGVYFLIPDLFRDLAGQVVTFGGDQADTVTNVYGAGREQFLLDTTEGFLQANREYHQGSSSGSGLVQAGLAEVYTTWSQYVLDDVADSRLRAEKGDSSKAAAFEARAKLQEDEFRLKLIQAQRFVEAALKLSPGSVEAHRSAADYYRLAGDLERAKQHVAEALTNGAENQAALPETEYVKALVDLAVDGDVDAAIGRLEGVVKRNDSLIRCHFRLARLYAAGGDRSKAVTSLEKIVALNGHHERAPELLKALRGSDPIFIAVTSLALRPEPVETADAGHDAATDAEAAVAAAPPGDGGPTTPQVPTGPSSPVEEPFETMVRRATKLQNSGSAGEACLLFRRADKVRAGNAEVLVGLGYCAMDSGSGSQAMAYFQRALRGNASYGPALIALASTYRRQGNTSQALEYYRRYLQTNPGGPDATIARQNIERLEEQNAQPATQSDATPQTDASVTPSPGEVPPAQTPGQDASQPGTPENPSVTRITEDHSPSTPRSDSLTTGSEPPLRPGEDLE